MAGVSFLVAAGANTGGIVLWRKCKNDIFITYQILIPGRGEEGAKRELFYRVGADKVLMALQGDARRVRCGCDARGCVTGRYWRAEGEDHSRIWYEYYGKAFCRWGCSLRLLGAYGLNVSWALL